MITRSMDWLQQHDHLIFRWLNRKISNKMVDSMLSLVTHMGGAIFTIVLTLSIAFFAPEPWYTMGWQSFIALSLSFLITALIKKKLRRIRPYQALEKVRFEKKPMKDHSFPSGHSTAIFSIVTPFLFVTPWLSLLLILLALTVSLSRIYLGFHYPSDCLAGCFVGTASALLIVLS
ncbi:phosphatidylglycerophosphatase B [Paenibacillus lautus]|uniref:phosphatase PAP2 family protein n=1 Tax=Paenibacillus lautus TaxID=1401 RepID=UPI001B27A17B|nr:phosphatase PAP2 family protein [Paenibacillus lautus]GIP07801.1 phosphatidylglycerophosphatase B [Paenibacillus lautus]